MPHTPESRSEALVEALPYIQQFRGQTFVIKYGGSAMEDENMVERFLKDIVFLEAVGINPVLVHGGGKAITARMRKEGLSAAFVNGLRVTDEQTVGIVESELDGNINPRIVRTIEGFGGKACGVSGKNVFTAEKLPPQEQEDGSTVDIGFVGAVADLRTAEVERAVADEVVPVISCIGADASGTLLNINADPAAAALAKQLGASKLIFVSDVRGIMRDPADTDSLIPTVCVSDVEPLKKQKVLHGGMIPKVQSAIEALEAGVRKVHLICGAIPHCLLLEIFTNSGIGTEIVTKR